MSFKEELQDYDVRHVWVLTAAGMIRGKLRKPGPGTPSDPEDFVIMESAQLVHQGKVFSIKKMLIAIDSIIAFELIETDPEGVDVFFKDV